MQYIYYVVHSFRVAWFDWLAGLALSESDGGLVTPHLHPLLFFKDKLHTHSKGDQIELRIE